MKDENSNSAVIDASYMLAFLLPDEISDAVTSTFLQYKEGTIHFLVSPILPLEVLNGIKSAVIRRRITAKKGQELIEGFQEITITIHELPLKRLLSIALTNDISIYDASYAYLAMEKKVPLLTLDKRLAKLTDSA